MKPEVIIYGTETCPFVKKAREDYGDKAIFYNVKTDPERLPEPKGHWPKGHWPKGHWPKGHLRHRLRRHLRAFLIKG